MSTEPRDEGRPTDHLALKEWQVSVDALLRGELAFVMRKGGIHEPGNRFLAQATRFWLFPTYEHQVEYLDEGVELLKEPWLGRVRVARCRHRSDEESARTGIGPHTPSAIPIEGYAEVRSVHTLWTHRSVEALAEFGIWTPGFAEARVRWKPRSPLAVFVLQAHRLAQPLSVPADEVPKRCYSWLDIRHALTGHPGKAVDCASVSHVTRLCEALEQSADEIEARAAGRVSVGPSSSARAARTAS